MSYETDLVYLESCNSLKRLSKCQFTQVACVFVNDSGRIVSTGVNGTISGEENCEEVHFEHREDHKPYSDENEIHAEMNAILDLARSGFTPTHLTVYTTLSPCENCLKHLLGLTKRKGSSKVTIDKIIFGERYHRLTDEDVSRMKQKCTKHGVELKSIEEIRNEFQTEAG